MMTVKRFIAFFLITATLLTSLIACDTASNSEGETTDTATNEDTSNADVGLEAYTVVYPDSASSLVKKAMEDLVTAIADATGITLQTKSDYIKRGSVYDSTTLEILFGRTAYDETATVLKTLDKTQFAIRAQGNKIVITSPTDANLSNAVSYIKDKMIPANLKEENGKKTFTFSDYTSDVVVEDTSLKINGVKLEDFIIVYETTRIGYDEVATRLADMIKTKFNITLNVYPDSRKTEVTNEILVGKTNRSTSATVYSTSAPKLMTYEVVVTGGKLQIVSGGPFSARECVDYLEFSISSLKSEGTYFKTDLATASASLANGADIRIMTSNVLAARWGEDATGEEADKTPPVAQRAEIYAAVLAKYQPDAVGVQEADQKWINQFPAYLTILKQDYGLEYTWLFNKHDGVQNMTSILYRSDKYQLVESGVQVNSYWSVSQKGYHLRIYTWANLKNKTDPTEQFILLNTHWAWESDDWVKKSINEEIALIKSLRERFNLPIFCTGDFNCKQDTSDYNRFMREAEVADLYKQAKTLGCLVNDCGGCGKIGASRSGGNYIDHIFGSGNYTTMRYETVVANRIAWLSDHSPQFADIKLS